MDEHPFEIFTRFPWVWGPLYGGGILIGLVCLAVGPSQGAIVFLGGVLGSIVVISFWSVLLWEITK